MPGAAAAGDPADAAQGEAPYPYPRPKLQGFRAVSMKSGHPEIRRIRQSDADSSTKAGIPRPTINNRQWAGGRPAETKFLSQPAGLLPDYWLRGGRGTNSEAATCCERVKGSAAGLVEGLAE